MNNLLGPYGLLRATGLTTLISASNSSIVRFSDYLVTMNQNGMIDYQGSPQGSGFLSMSESTQILEGTEPITTLRDEKSQDTTQPTIVPSQAQESTPTTSQAMLEELDMTRQVGDTSVHKYYIKAAGVKSTLIFLSALVLVAFSESFSQIWLLWWTEDVEKSPNSSTGRWLGVYAAFGVLGVLGNMLAAWFVFSSLLLAQPTMTDYSGSGRSSSLS